MEKVWWVCDNKDCKRSGLRMGDTKETHVCVPGRLELMAKLDRRRRERAPEPTYKCTNRECPKFDEWVLPTDCAHTPKHMLEEYFRSLTHP